MTWKTFSAMISTNTQEILKKQEVRNLFLYEMLSEDEIKTK